ncbi:nadph:adrenodoxin oxidoreductase [Plasmopara halstedii]|uniref:NADPH:adrenodoxin oxidoreductase, mitochondrial n=1 Tax=Plasmopara halstedii TaxID=4781 RepID=A0A0P1AP60_PLAHL|nr:nadph:adrenodoxin oxidoreductase [Plasmopara halstedii]CEG43054.1 nadph:adrenodoxin oxidoreductase [Plasmopara halstedii]|eukprot:XP_024579423.1 nadph:adrenodoxin oxidoreductase [Plasmopara halstedii]
MLEMLPTPFGLVRFGVAPDHPEVKSVMNEFNKVASDTRFRFLGNVCVGEDVTLSELQQHYHAIVLAYGAAGDRQLNIPGENLNGVMSARSFVNWYNGHPSFCNLKLDLTQIETAVVIGHGNVGVDCARLLTKNVEELASTDIADYAIEALRKSKIRNVVIIGRRGSTQAAFTMKELRELTKLDGVKCVVDPEDLRRSITPASEQEMRDQRGRKRMNDVLNMAAEHFDTAIDTKRVVQIKFLSLPIEFLADESDPMRVGAIRVEKTKLEGKANQQRAVGTGDFEVIPCGLVLRSIGYKSEPIDMAIPFDTSRDVIANDQGRVVTYSDGKSHPIVGLYCTGWVKRGPTGIIGTNIMDARETVSCILDDFATGKCLNSSDKDLKGLEAVESLIKKRNPDKQVVRWADYERVNTEEKRRGEMVGKPREKITSVDEMLEIVKSGY